MADTACTSGLSPDHRMTSRVFASSGTGLLASSLRALPLCSVSTCTFTGRPREASSRSVRTPRSQIQSVRDAGGRRRLRDDSPTHSPTGEPISGIAFIMVHDGLFGEPADYKSRSPAFQRLNLWVRPIHTLRSILSIAGSAPWPHPVFRSGSASRCPGPPVPAGRRESDRRSASASDLFA